jgi:error-prone DNA polymerase
VPRSPGVATPCLPAYAELFCRSNFSFLSGASHPEELVARAQALGYAALALTDECSLAGVVRAHAEAERLGMRLIVGAEMALSTPRAGPAVSAPPAAAPAAVQADDEANDRAEDLTEDQAEDQAELDAARRQAQASDGPRLVLLAQSRRGYANLSQWVTLARRRAPKGHYQALCSDLEGQAPTAPMLAGLPGCFALLLPQAAQPFETLFAHATWLLTWFGADRAAIAVPRQHLAHDEVLLQAVQRVAAVTGLRLVAAGGVAMHCRSRKPLLDVLTATRWRRRVADAGMALGCNAEAHLRSRQRLAALYPEDWLAQTLAIAGRCAFSLNELKYEYPREIVPAGHSPVSWLRHLTEEGAAGRYPQGVPPPVRAMVEHELALIGRLKYEPYFLTVADIVAWARTQGILCQGRGSAANSAVCYCLGVTAVDPEVHTMLLFERFISEERGEPPDIDIDFEHQRREEVIQYIYRKYGRHRAALTAVVIRYRPRSALRDVGRALGIDLDRIDAVSKSQHWFDGRSIDPERLRENGFDPASPLCRLWVELTQQLIGFPRHLSQHPGGFVIARDTLAELVPVENAAMAERSVIQWDKDDLDALGLLKVDILALGMLSAIRRGLEFVGAKQGRSLELHQIPKEDAATYTMLSAGDSVGTFQVESRAQMSMLPRLRPANFYDLVIEVAIVRPGPIQGGMVHPYLRRRNGEEPVDYPSAEVEKALSRTLGVPIFQEQVMQLAILAADFTPGEADQLRRAMAAWKRKGGLGPFHARLVGRMVEKGYEREYAERIFKQIEGFGEYGFPESHAASFALLVYASAWLKRHHPDAFLAALLNSQPMGFYAPAQLVRDAREHGVQVHPVCVNRSAWDSDLEEAAADEDRSHTATGPTASPTTGPPTSTSTSPPTCPSTNSAAAAPQPLRPVRLGLNRIAGLAQEAALRLLAARAEAPFTGVEDLARRAGLDAHALGLLARANALAPLAGHRHQAAWAVAGVDTRASALLRATRTHEDTPAARALPVPGTAAATLADYRSVGLSLGTHPVALLRAQLAACRVQPASVLRGYPTGRLARASGLVTHRQRPETAGGVVFVTIEDDTGSVNIIVWPQVAQAQRRALLSATLLTVYGVWQSVGGVHNLVARTLVDHTVLLQGLATRSRDFR